jgi:hypothetical protein
MSERISGSIEMQRRHLADYRRALESLYGDPSAPVDGVKRLSAAKQCWNTLAVMDDLARTDEERGAVRQAAESLKELFTRLRVGPELLFEPGFQDLRAVKAGKS